ncbi:MAG TPA: DUF2950 domain-containing protein [Tepidisphaeraceae bacterium]|nr:DUF2950 domain-containing protein [Tepidisphaeraceae bacterium]
MLWKRFQNALILMALAGLTEGCSSSPPPTAPPTTVPSARVFDSPEAAVSSLVDALRAHDAAQLSSIFRPDDEEIISSGDPVADQAEIDRFLAAYDAKHYLQSDLGGGVILYVGQQEWPFPVPIIRSGGGYAFDSATGKDEILNRRIGRNELSAEQVCLAIVDAQRDYVTMRPMGGDLPVYARRLVSHPGTKDGLYWPTKDDEPPSPLGPLVAYATEEGYGATRASEEPPPYHGYRYRLLTKQGVHATGGAMDYEVDGQLIGGFAVVAYPADYGNSGITTFITNHDGVVYERDLGPDTEQLARQMTEFDPGPGWIPAGEDSESEGR